MKALPFIIAVVLFCAAAPAGAQSDFSLPEYGNFLRANQNLPSGTLLSRHAPKTAYFKSQSAVLTGEYAWQDSAQIKYDLTTAEMDLLQRNGFMVTERKSFTSFGQAYQTIWNNDLPVFISTDAILQALHASYDRMLMDLEMYRMGPNLKVFLDALSASYPKLVQRYGANEPMKESLADVDLYLTIARSLQAGTQLAPQYADKGTVDAVWKAIQAEQMTAMPLFSVRPRKLDFSQFTVRGHYAREGYVQYLGPYFKTMMWLGRTDFLLTPPPAYDEAPWGREEIRRMNLGAVLVNELVELSGKRTLLDENDEIITFLIGESDNLTPGELAEIIRAKNLSGADALLNDTMFDAFQAALLSAPGAGQRILSDIFMMNPLSDKPEPLPVSFRLMGQKFILDSYVFSNVVYDRVIYNGQKIWRPMPDPLDAMFVLGNDDALPLLNAQLDKYHYSAQLSGLRYLVDAYDDDFWGVSLYNTWLSAIRALNPAADRTKFPYFMQTAAWGQEKLNTQLASWAQLRHDNLLYAKQSYTGGVSCSFPHSYVEPYPEFYHRVSAFAQRAGAYFERYNVFSTPIGRISWYFQGLKTVMDRLEIIARKELDGQALTAEEKTFLQEMLYTKGSGGCGPPPFVGWYRDIFYDPEELDNMDFIVADVHTQPTDEFGSMVGRVLHVGTGWVNLGVFLVDAPFAGVGPTAFVGPVMSYHEKVTDNFDRLTDQRWQEMVVNHQAPARPDWVNIYLADAKGNTLGAGRELPGILPTGVGGNNNVTPQPMKLLAVNPNPFNPSTTVSYTVPSAGPVTLAIYDILGRKVATLVEGNHAAGTYSVLWDARNAASGMYFCRIQAAGRGETAKMVLVR
ncbi:MAG: DUF3160 domain-containing protein [Candidatus Latescibacterota bacterium]